MRGEVLLEKVAVALVQVVPARSFRLHSVEAEAYLQYCRRMRFRRNLALLPGLAAPFTVRHHDGAVAALGHPLIHRHGRRLILQWSFVRLR
jgi:hypothetical protein